MKLLSALIFGFVLAGKPAISQTSPRTKIYLGNFASSLVNLSVPLNPGNTIEIPKNGYTIVDVDSDSLGLTVGNRTVFVPLTKGQIYFYQYTRNGVVQDCSELTFWLNVNSFGNAQRHNHYFLDKKFNLSFVDEPK